MRITDSVGMLLLGIWLILQAAIVLFSLRVNGRDVLLAVLALIAGILIIFGG